MAVNIEVKPADVHDLLAQHMLVDGFDLVLDTNASRGSWLVDARTGQRYLDFLSFVASAPFGVNPPELVDDPAFVRHLGAIAVNKPANPDMYTVEYARFVATFARVLGDPALPYLFFIDGGTLAVENALKAAFDWKAKRTGPPGRPRDRAFKVMHLARAFHGRSGYAISLTNTDPAKTALFPKFDWPRIPVPAARFPLARHERYHASAEAEALAVARAVFEDTGDDLACFIAEPIQGEGGDNHLRAEFLHAMQDLCHRYDALFVLDEVQTGCGTTGTAWAYQQLGLAPDLVAFGKKTQVCGVMAGRRIDDVPDHVFRVPSRLSSTWGGNLTDMVRATRIFEVIERDRIFETVRARGEQLLAGLVELAGRFPRRLGNARGRGLMCAIDCAEPAVRDTVIRRLYAEEHVIVLPAGDRTIRFRPCLTVGEAEIRQVLDALDRSVRVAGGAA